MTHPFLLAVSLAGALMLASTTATADELYDFVNEEKVTVEDPEALSAEEAMVFVPPSEELYDLYIAYIEAGERPYVALMRTYQDFARATRKGGEG